MATDPTRSLMHQTLGEFGRLEKNQIEAKLGAAGCGRKEGSTLRGRNLSDHYDGAAAALEGMELRAGGLAFRRIAAGTNSDGWPTRTGKPWHSFVVDGTLSEYSTLNRNHVNPTHISSEPSRSSWLHRQ